MIAHKPTSHDVAVRAGVSQKTVSRVMNGDEQVSERTRSAVQAAAAELGYRPNAVARQLRPGSRTHVVGLIVGDVGNPWTAELTRTIESALRPDGYFLMIGSSQDDPEREREITSQLLARQVDALLVVPTSGDHSHLAADVEAGTPVIFLDRPGEGLEADCVLPRHREASRAAVRHLLSYGHERIALVGADPAAFFSARERYEGYLDAHREVGVEVDPDLLCLGPLDAADAQQGLRALLDGPRPPTAVFAANNRMTVGVLRALEAAGEGAQRTAVVGFDHVELAECLRVPLTTVEYSARDLGLAAVDILRRRLADPNTRNTPYMRHHVESALVPRGSGELRVLSVAQRGA